MLTLLLKYEKGDADALNLLETSTMMFIPIVNPDGFRLISEYYITTGQFLPIRKNRFSDNNFTPCSSEVYGIDLNRNYPFAWGYDNQGSSDDQWVRTISCHRASKPLWDRLFTLRIRN